MDMSSTTIKLLKEGQIKRIILQLGIAQDLSSSFT